MGKHGNKHQVNLKSENFYFLLCIKNDFGIITFTNGRGEKTVRRCLSFLNFKLNKHFFVIR
jgi:hypothetical protein